MPFVPDTYKFTPPLHLPDNRLRFGDHCVRVRFSSSIDPSPQIVSIRRPNSEPRFPLTGWKIGEIEQVLPGLYLATLWFDGDGFSNAICDQKEPSLLQAFIHGERLHFTVKVNQEDKAGTPLFLELDYTMNRC